MNTTEKKKTTIQAADEKKRFLADRERKLWWLLMLAIGLSFGAGLLNGFLNLGGWEVIVPVMTIVDYTIYYFWSESQVKKYEVEHIALGYYANDKKTIPPKQLKEYDKLKFEYIIDVLKNTIIIALLCGGLVYAGQKVAEGMLIWLLVIVLLPLGIAIVMRNQKHQINRFGKNGNKIMSK